MMCSMRMEWGWDQWTTDLNFWWIGTRRDG